MQPNLQTSEHNNGIDRGQQNGAARGASLLLIWLSPSFPVGAFAYSHGLETAVAKELVHDRQSLTEWLDDLVRGGAPRNDMILMALAWDSVAREDHKAFDEMNDLAIALQPSSERKLETVAQGNAFMAAATAAWPAPKMDGFIGKRDIDMAYPMAVALASAAHGVARHDTLNAYGIAFVGNLISAAIRLGVIGQTDGQRIQATLLPLVATTARQLEFAGLDDLGGATWMSDLCAMQHEIQHTRLFRS
ncbi:MAG: urease accessory protein UreF [Hyphomicrobiaceae bacterium]